MGKSGRTLLYTGLLICIISLSLPWGRTAGEWQGGYSYVSTPSGDPVIAWNPAARFDPSPSYPSFPPVAVGLLLGLTVWGAAKTAQARRLRRMAAAAYGLLVVWWLFQITLAAGVWVFLGGLGMLGAGLLIPGRKRG